MERKLDYSVLDSGYQKGGRGRLVWNMLRVLYVAYLDLYRSFIPSERIGVVNQHKVYTPYVRRSSSLSLRPAFQYYQGRQRLAEGEPACNLPSSFQKPAMAGHDRVRVKILVQVLGVYGVEYRV